MDLANFETVQPADLKAGFYADIKRKKDQPKKKKLILIRTPKNIKAADLDGIKLDITGSKTSVSSTVFALEDSDAARGTKRTFKIIKGMDGELAPVAIALLTHSSISIGIIHEKGFDEVWHMGLSTDLPVEGRLEVDLEDDIGGRNWRQVPQATNLRVPLSVVDVDMKQPPVVVDSVSVGSATPAVASPLKKSKKRKSEQA